MNRLDKNVQKLGSSISLTDDDKRTVAYTAVVRAYLGTIDKEINTLSANDIKVRFQDLYYELNEVAVTDKDLFMSVVNKFVSFVKNPIEADGLANDFTDVIGIRKSFGTGFVELINENISIYREVYNKAISVFRG